MVVLVRHGDVRDELRSCHDEMICGDGLVDD
jgi:hypothetical protein